MQEAETNLSNLPEQTTEPTRRETLTMKRPNSKLKQEAKPTKKQGHEKQDT